MNVKLRGGVLRSRERLTTAGDQHEANKQTGQARSASFSSSADSASCSSVANHTAARAQWVNDWSGVCGSGCFDASFVLSTDEAAPAATAVSKEKLKGEESTFRRGRRVFI